MHRHRVFFRFGLPLALAFALAAAAGRAAQSAAPLYGAVVADSDAQSAAQSAMRDVLVRLTGARDAGNDPALAGLVTDARRYVQSQRRTTSGTTQVLFDATTLRNALAAAGRSVWGPERPLVWVQLPAQERSEAAALRARLSAAAQARGLPILIASADAAPGAVSSEVALAAARRAGANAALTAQISPSDPQSLEWTLSAPTGDGHWVGTAELAVDGTTDALVQAAQALEAQPLADVACEVSGVADLSSFAAVLSALRNTPEVATVTVREVDAGSLQLVLRARGGSAELTRALAADRLRVAGTDARGVLELRYQAAP